MVFSFLASVADEHLYAAFADDLPVFGKPKTLRSQPLHTLPKGQLRNRSWQNHGVDKDWEVVRKPVEGSAAEGFSPFYIDLYYLYSRKIKVA